MKTDYSSSITNALYLFFIQGVNYIVPLIILPYLLKTLGPEKYGIIGLGQSFVQYFILIVDFGFNISAVRRIAINKNNPEQLSKIFWSTMSVKSILCCICLVVHIILVATVPLFQLYERVLNVFFLMVIGNVLFPVWFFQGIEKMRILAYVNFIVKLSILPMILLFVKHQSDYFLAAALQSIVFLFSGVLSLVFIFSKGYIKRYKVTFQSMIIEVKESWLVFLSSAAINVYTSSFVLILGFFATTTAIGYYTAAERIMRVSCYMIAAPISQAFFPRISELVHTDKEKAIKMLKMVLNITFLSFIFIGILLFFCGNLIVKVVGESYQNCIFLLKILCLVPLLIGLSGVLGQLGLLAFGENEKYAKSYFITGICSIIAVFSLTYFFKEVGTAWALFFTELIVVVLMYKYVKESILNSLDSKK